MENTNEDLVIYPKTGKMIILLLMSIVFVLLGGFLIYVGLEERIMFVIIGIISILFFGFSGIFILNRLINKQPALIISKEGITDHSSYTAGGYIAWEEVRDITLYDLFNQRMIGIKLHDTDKFMSQQTGVKKMLMNTNKNMVDAPVNIAEASLPIGIEQLYLIMMKKWKESMLSRQPIAEDRTMMEGQSVQY